ncbi:MAG TPA: hypothetical protein DHV14_00125 [Micrococcales bacterium]|uniref:DUF3618 domain-containing protein n=1 Tax=Miniimonas arenae TaxID=676201 RepID=UPI000EEB1333|nr:DUF3618 domain-containing protein [Miniimonas arenae]HCX83558.1 hypothetical protein [Micrococcales bacterium]
MTTSNDPDEIRAEIDRTRQQVANDVDVLGEKVSPAAVAQRQGERIKAFASDAKDAVFGSAEDAKARTSDAASSAADSARGLADSAREAVGNAPDAVRSRARGNPLAVGLIGFGAGLLISSLIPASRKEQELATKVKDSDEAAAAKDAFTDVAHGLLDSAKESAQSVAEQAKESVAVVKEERASAAQDVKASAQGAAASTKDALA